MEACKKPVRLTNPPEGQLTPFWAYVNYQTNVWWNRADSNYDVYAGQQTNQWNFWADFDCQTDSADSRTASGGNWSPAWPGGTGDSTTYVYNGPMNLWPGMYRPSYTYSIDFPQTTNVGFAGSPYGSLSNTYGPPIGP